MGVCYSCLRTIYPEDGSTSSNGPNETTPLIQEYSSNSINANNPYRNDPDRLDRAKRQQALNTIVGFTGENLIDVTSVAQPEVHIIGKPAAEYRRLLAEISDNPGESTSNRSILPKLPTMKVLSEEERTWLKGLSKSASDTLLQEAPVKLPGPLVHTF